MSFGMFGKGKMRILRLYIYFSINKRTNFEGYIFLNVKLTQIIYLDMFLNLSYVEIN